MNDVNMQKGSFPVSFPLKTNINHFYNSFFMSLLLSLLENLDKSYQQSLIAKVGSIVSTNSISKQISLANKKKAIIFYLNFNLEMIRNPLDSKEISNINLDTIVAILSAIEENNKAAVDNFDCIVISYSNKPIVLLVNQTKFEQQIENSVECAFQKFGNPDNTSELQKDKKEALVSKIKEDKQRILEEKLELGLSKMDEYSYFIDVNHHLHEDIITSRKNVFWFLGSLLACGASLVVFFGFTRNFWLK